MQVLLDKIKHDPYWDKISESYDPITLLKSFDKEMNHTKHQYFYETFYNQECAIHVF